MAAPAFVAAGLGPTSTTTSVAIPKPTGTAAGHVLYALVTNGGAPSAPTTVPAGWTLTTGLAVGGTSWVGLYERIAGASEPTSYTWSGFTDSCAGSMIAISGADPATPTHLATGAAAPNSATPSCSGITTTAAECLILAAVGVADNVGVSAWACATDPAVLTERAEVQSTGGADSTSAIATAPQTAPGPTGTFSATLAGSRNSVAILVAVQPPQSGGGGQTVSPSAIATGEAHGTPALALGITPSGIATGEAHGAPSSTTGLAPAGIGSAEAFGAPVLAQDGAIAPGSIGSGEAHGQPAITTGLAAAGIASAEAIGTPALTQAGTIAPAGITSAEAHGTPLLTRHLTPVGIGSGEQLGTPVLGLGLGGGPEIPGEDAPDAGGIPSAEQHGTPSLALAVAAVGTATGEAFGTPAVRADVALAPAGIASAAAYGTPTVTAGDLPAGPDLLALAGTLAPAGGLAGPLAAADRLTGTLT